MNHLVIAVTHSNLRIIGGKIGIYSLCMLLQNRRNAFLRTFLIEDMRVRNFPQCLIRGLGIYSLGEVLKSLKSPPVSVSSALRLKPWDDRAGFGIGTGETGGQTY